MNLSSKIDPLLAAESYRAADRLHYAVGELLGADDFRDEQTYHRGRLARALLYLHGSGTVAGLRVLVEGRRATPTQLAFDEVELKVQPGIAIDRAGRLIEVPRPWCIRLRRWYEDLANRLPGILRAAFRANTPGASDGMVESAVLLSFHACERGLTPAFAAGPFDALDASQPSRLRDAHQLRLVPSGTATPSADPSPWSGITTANWQETILNAWTPPAQIPPNIKNEDEARQTDTDLTSLRLALLRVPAQLPAGTAAPTPDWSVAAWDPPAARVDNLVREFVLPVAALQRLATAP